MSQSDEYAERAALPPPPPPLPYGRPEPLSPQDLDVRFSAHSVSPIEANTITRLRWEARRFANIIVGAVPDGRERSLAITHLEEAIFWAVAGIARS